MAVNMHASDAGDLKWLASFGAFLEVMGWLQGSKLGAFCALLLDEL